ncbi:MAG: oligosaccharide flippase family protein [Prevotellaceae bacterium]|nr:oligosaccharide flippase family protein [Prevotellaceae bacterium]
MPLDKYIIVAKNFGYLSVLNALNMVLPLISIPYLTNTIGTSYYGVYIYVLVLVQSINVITQYGFQFSATKKISQNRNDKAFVERISSTVLVARFFIATICIALILGMSRWLLDTDDRLLMFITALGMVYGDVFIPTWLFQGMERMKFVTIVNAVSKILFTLLIFIVISSPNDYRYILLLNSVGFIVAAVLSMTLVKVQFGLSLRMPRLNDVWHELRESFTLFLSMIGIDLYRNVNVIVLKFFVSDAAVGIYAIAEKVIKATQSFITPISQALFPHVSLKIKSEGIGSSMHLLYRASFLLVCFTIAASVGIYLCGDFLVSLTGKDFGEIKPLMSMMYPVLVFGCLNYLLGIVGLVNLGQQKFFFYAVFLSGTVSLLLLLLFARYWGVQIAAITISMSEILLFIACACRLGYLHKKESQSKK